MADRWEKIKMNCFICSTYGETEPATRDSIYEQGERVCDYHYWCEVDDNELEDWDDVL